MRACVWVRGCVRTYVFMRVSVSVRVGRVRGYVYAWVEGIMFIIIILCYFCWCLRSGGKREKRKGTYVAWTNDGAVPVGHEDIIAILEAVRARSIADSLLALFEFLEQAEVAWDCLGILGGGGDQCD